MNQRYPIGRTTLMALTCAACFGPLAQPAAAQAVAGEGILAGEWTGAARTPTGLLALTLDLRRSGDRWTATFAVPAEGVEVPVSEIRVHDDSVVATIMAGRVLRGHVVGDSLGGELEIDGRSMPAVLGRAGTAVARRLTDQLAASADAAPPAPLARTAVGPALGSVEPRALDRLIGAANASHSDALVVLRGGDLVAAWHAGGQRQLIETMSATKSILNLAIGRLVTTGAIETIDQPVHAFYPEWRDGPKSHITIRHLLNHTSGLESPQPTTPIYNSDDFVQFALDAALEAPPGTTLRYNNNATNLLAGLVERAAGERLDRFLGNDLFARLGITRFRWSLDRAGNPHGMAGAQMYAEDLATLGQLVLQRGQWEGEQLIDEAWFAESLSPGSDLSGGVGLLWWLIRQADDIIGYRADGYLGQYLIIYPDQELVAVRLVAQNPAYNPETDGFREFQALVRDLVPLGHRDR
jgi:CubicO group peptidase (beta-lactamase class C family)